jgi:formate-dependent nitrite reductase membrane component NrfD
MDVEQTVKLFLRYSGDGMIRRRVADAQEVFMMDWVPIVFITFKVLALGTAMFFAIKWHYDQGKKVERRAVIRTGGKLAAVFVLALLGVGLVAFVLSRMLGLDLSYP